MSLVKAETLFSSLLAIVSFYDTYTDFQSAEQGFHKSFVGCRVSHGPERYGKPLAVEKATVLRFSRVL